MRTQHTIPAAIAAFLAMAMPAAATTVYGNNLIPGDAFANAGPTNQGQAVGTSGWHYNNV